MQNKTKDALHMILFPMKDMTYYDLVDSLLDSTIWDEEDPAKKKAQKAEIKKRIHSIMILKCDSDNIDEIDLLFYKYYVYDNRKTSIIYKCIDYIFAISRSLISVRDGNITLKYWKSSVDDMLFGPYDETEKSMIFSELIRTTSSSVFVAAHFAENEIFDIEQLDGVYQNIILADAPLHDVLIRGVSENHVHTSAAFNFEVLWQILMNDNYKKDYLRSFQVNCYANHLFRKDIEYYILLAGLLRLVLACYTQYYYSVNPCTLDEWLLSNFSYEEEIYKPFMSLLFDTVYPSKDIKYTMKEIIELLKSRFNITKLNYDEDYVFYIYNTNVKTYGENIVLLYTLRLLKKTISDTDFDGLRIVFFKYMMIKNEFYGQIVQAYRIKGLDFFQEYFHRATDALIKDKTSIKLLIRTMFQDEYLKKIEFRLSFPGKLKQLQQYIAKFLSCYYEVLHEDYYVDESLAGSGFPRIGIIFHMIKQKDKKGYDKCWRMSKKEKEEDNLLMFQENQLMYKRQIEALLELRNEVPYLADFIVGIDAASLENNTPIQVFAPIFKLARDSSKDGRKLYDMDGKIVKVKSLFYTFHAGEDFRHVTSGLRRMDELIEFCKYHSGDRIGHGIALGLDIEEWTRRNSVVIIPRGEYLDNLLWSWGVYSESQTLSQTTCIYLENIILKTAKEIFDDLTGITIYNLYECYRKRFELIDLDTLERNNFCEKANESECVFKKYDKIWDVNKLYAAYHCKHYLMKMNEPIFVRTDRQEKIIAKEMQKYVRDRLSVKGIVVEVNPSSNALISEVDTTYNNQIFELNRHNDFNNSNIIGCINSDDPIVFNTTVSSEMAYLYYDLINKGYGKESALQWLDKMRKAGMETSFVDVNSSDEEYVRRLKLVIKVLTGNDVI